jgi:AAA domain
MSSNNAVEQPLVIIRGRSVRAVYRKPECPDYDGNPMIEALPPVLTDDQASTRLEYYTAYDDSQRLVPKHVRYLLIQNGLKFFAPLDIHLDLQRRVSNLLRVGYARRNPSDAGFWKKIRPESKSFDQYQDQYGQQPDRLPSTAAGFNIIGPSGVGKSFSVERVLSLTPQVIYHSNFRGQKFTYSQLVWLKLDCPFDANPRGLCIRFFKTIDHILGTRYCQNYVKSRRLLDELLDDMATVANNHCVGVLVIDEIQRLNLAKSEGADKLLNFFVQLVNDIGVPVILVGNYKALTILSGDFSQMRRGTGQGDLIWDLMKKNEQWQLFVESLWRFQYTRKRCSPGDLEHPPKRARADTQSAKEPISLSDILYEETQGITDFAVKVYMFAQERAIDTGREAVTGNIISSVAKDKLQLPREVLCALKTKDVRVLERYEDLYHKSPVGYLDQQPDKPQLAGNIETRTIIKEVIPEGDRSPNEGAQGSAVNVASEVTPAGPPTKQETPESPSSKKRKPSRSGAGKGELPQIIASLKTKDGATGYEALKLSGHIRPASEFSESE